MEQENTLSLIEVAKSIPGFDPWRNSEGYYFDEKMAQDAIDFLGKAMVHIKGDLAGENLVMETWQKAIIANIFGWQDELEENTRRFKEVFLYIPRKNGKSFLASGICLLVLFCDGEMGGELICAAYEKKQAGLVFEVAKKQIARDKEMSAEASIFKDSIILDANMSTFMPVSSEAKSSHGGNLSLAVVDELHCQRDDELINTIRTSMGSRRQPLLMFISTADYDGETPCNREFDYAKNVRDGIFDDDDQNYLPIIYETDKDADWTDPKVWAAANPNLGVSVRLDYLKRECKRAQNDPTKENNFKRLQLNMQTSQSYAYLNMDDWDKGNVPVDIEKLKGRECFGGLDLANINDLASFVLLFPAEDDFYDLLAWFWCPENDIEKRKQNGRVPYPTWEKQGFLTKTPGNVIDYDFIERDIVQASEDFEIQAIGFDIFNATQIVTNLRDKHGINMEVHRQGFLSMTRPTKELLKCTMAGNIRHGGNPLLRWNASNLMVKKDEADCVKPNKKAAKDKIDGVVAEIMALGMATDSEQADRPYKDRGFLSV